MSNQITDGVKLFLGRPAKSCSQNGQQSVNPLNFSLKSFYEYKAGKNSEQICLQKVEVIEGLATIIRQFRQDGLETWACCKRNSSTSFHRFLFVTKNKLIDR